jgi:membrane dipeptidase
MDRLGMILDLTHLSDEAFWEAMDLFKGQVWASHCNCRSIIPHQRQLNDDQLKAIIQRNGVIGMVFDAWMMHVGWERGTTTPQSAGLKLERIIDHIDHICQLAGNADHVGIGSDLDGGYGTEQCPADVQSIADLQNLEGLLTSRGYTEAQIRSVFHGNFLNALRRAWA